MTDFKPKRIVKESVSKQVFFEIKKRIIEGYWKEGEKLPSENELADAFGVSRLSVRSALQSLAALKIVKIKNGEGTYVRKFELTNVLDNISDMITESISVEDLNAYRYFFESACIKLISDRNPEINEFDKMKKCCDEMENAAKVGDYLKYNEWDLEFHHEFCRLSNNKMFEYSNSLFRNMYKHYYALNVETPEDLNPNNLSDWSKGVKFHKSFYNHLVKKEYDKALEAIASVTHKTK